MTSPGGGGKSGGGKSTTIGYATLQLIPSLKGVTEAIEQQIDGKVVSINVTPKVDQRAAEDAGRQTKAAVEKQTADVKVTPKVDTRAAEQAGKATGDAVAKGANDAVRKGDIGKTVSDEVTETVKKSSPGKDLAKIIVEGLADGAKDELRGGGPLIDVLVDGLASGVKSGIDRGGLGKTILDTVSRGMKSGNPAGAIRDAVLPGINQVGTDLRTGTANWARDIAGALRGGDIQGATDNIGSKVRSTTDLIANIGSTFGLQLDDVREFGDQSATMLDALGKDVGGAITTALDLKNTFTDIGTTLESVLPGKAGKGAAGITAALGRVAVPAWLAYLVGQQNPFNQAPTQNPDGSKTFAPGLMPGQSPNDKSGATVSKDGRLTITDKDGKPFRGKLWDEPELSGGSGSFDGGGYTGAFPIDKIAGVVHGKEYVVNADSTANVEKDHPGALDYLNKTGKLPGFAGGGLVPGAQELRKVIGERFGISDIGGYRPGGDGFNEHSTGRALDVMVGSNKSKGDSVKDFVLANADAMDLKWVIWRQHLYYPGGGGYDMPDRGSPTQNHMDHVHIFSGPGIAAGLRGSLKGSKDTASAAQSASVVGPGAIDPRSSDKTGAAASANVTPAAAASSSASSSGGGFSLPSSISGLSGIGLSDLGVTTSTKIGDRTQDRTFDIGNAASAAVTGQVGSALGVFGVNDSPGWLQGISKLVGGISIGGGGDGGFGSAAPAAAAKAIGGLGGPVAGGAGIVHGANAGAQPGPPGVTYNITARDTEDAFVRAQQQEKERTAAKLSRY